MFGNKSKEPSYRDTSYNKETSHHDEARTSSRSNFQPQEKILTLISEGCKFEGNLSSPSTTKIDGHVVGNLRGESGIFIGEKGVVEGNINAVDVVISGTVKGNIKAHKLELRRSASLDGDIAVQELITESGSKFNGNSKMGSKTKSNIIDMKVDLKDGESEIESENDIEIRSEAKSKDKPVLKFH